MRDFDWVRSLKSGVNVPHIFLVNADIFSFGSSSGDWITKNIQRGSQENNPPTICFGDFDIALTYKTINSSFF
jgi:hypothetical protein